MTDTVVSERLIFTDLKENRNKFWHADLKGNILYLEWGRIGVAKQAKPLSFPTEEKARREFERRRNEKLRQGYTRQMTMAENAPVGVQHVAKIQIEHNNDKETVALIDFLIERNIHMIEGLTSVRFAAGKITTPLGPVTNEGLDEAQKLINQMAKFDSDFPDFVNQYLRIIPRNIGRARTDPRDIFGSMKQIQNEQAMLDSLRAVVKDVEQKAGQSGPRVFQTKLSLVDPNSAPFIKLAEYFKSGMNRHHKSYGMKLVRVWEMHIEKAEKEFDTKLGNVKGLWHGTRDANLLSILKSGYLLPRRNSTIHITGAMFGPGVYFSDQSTKSLNYAIGAWGGSSSQRAFMLFNDVALGREYTPTSGYGFSGKLPPGYNSCFAKAGHAGVRNNEFVVYNLNQIKPTYLCEFGK
jgi:poly [ADP-ribose] polymerase